MAIHIGIAAPVSTESIKHLLHEPDVPLPIGFGSSLLAPVITELLKRGHKVSVFTTSNDLEINSKQPFLAEGNNFSIYYSPQRKHSIRMNGKYLGRIVDFFYWERKSLLKAINKSNPDIVHAHWAYEFALAAISSGKPHIITCHDSPLDVLKFMPNIYRLGRFFIAFVAMKKAKKLTTVSPYMVKKIHLFTKRHVDVIPNPLSEQLMNTNVDDAKTINSNAPIIIMVSNGWNALKNCKAGLLAFSELKKLIPDAILKVYGDCFEKGGVANDWVIDKGIGYGIHFKGKLPYNDVLNEMAIADVFLHPSLEESFGMVLLEAMALGVPVVAGEKSGAVPWVVQKAGLVIDVAKHEHITNTLYELINNPELWDKLRRSGLKNVHQRFSTEMVTTSYENIYYNLNKSQFKAK
ncbi:glycosyltransferase family 4 protein [Thalassotalea psychrophila]|uniref:Glycosyltransferase family 4 protein n=1 Tax=Thalassotalea psychrophila TaxID=3065647 RepID=A0ABY9TRK9_9GAMM|nr:glycosyltransferase family 4 protein [Colwelliaceae bacterium SQ149]